MAPQHPATPSAARVDANTPAGTEETLRVPPTVTVDDHDTLLRLAPQQASRPTAQMARWVRLPRPAPLLRIGLDAIETIVPMRHGAPPAVHVPTPTLLIASAGALRRARLGTQRRPDGWHHFHAFHPNPTPESAEAAAHTARTLGARSIVALGGGSTMDLAKTAALLTGAHHTVASLRAAIRDGAPVRRGVTLVHLPTTAGTGACVTPFAALWPEDAPKFSVDHPAAQADLVLLDPDLVCGAPPALIGAAGMDATIHAIEATLGRHGTPHSRRFATRALQLIAPGFTPMLATDPPREVRAAMQLGATLAGVALATSRSAAAHALSYTLTARFGVPHGVAVGILTRALLPLQAELAPTPLQEILDAMSLRSVDALDAWIADHLTLAGLPTTLDAYGVTVADLDALIHDATQTNRLANNPGPPTPSALREALRRALG